jgi:7-keto-8-aminopelargonate synthetase-like enzyme
MLTLEQKPGRVTFIDGKEYLFFSGYSYLGLGCDEDFLQLIHDGIKKYGVVYPSSRISNTPLKLYGEWEEKLSGMTNSKESAVLSSGFLSARTAVEVVAEEMNIYYRYPSHPASSHHNKAIAIEHDWDQFFNDQLRKKEFRFGIMADSINPTPGSFNDFSYLNKFSEEFQITLILDDSHGIGWLGNNGEGILSRLQLPKQVDLLLNFSLSKAYHLNAGAVCGSSYWIQKVKQHVNFTTSTPPMPALAHAFLYGEPIFKLQRERLHQNIDYLRKLISAYTFVTNEGTPVFVVHKTSVAEMLLKKQILISSFGYPKPENDKVNRVVVNALHSSTDFEYLMTVLATL